MVREAIISLPENVWKIIDNKFKDSIRWTDSYIIESIVISYLTEKACLHGGFNLAGERYKSVEKISSDIDILALTSEALIEILQEKGIIKEEELQERMDKNLQA